MKTRTQDEIIEHLFANSTIDIVTGCILWQGSTAGRGYGVTYWRSKQVYIHRLAYQFEYPDEILNIVRHTCDTPNCWRVEHLVNGTTLENVQDKINKGRQPVGEAVGTSFLKDQQIVEIRNSNLNLYQAARKYGVSASNIYYIRKGKTWRHV